MAKNQNCVIWIQALQFIVYIKTDDTYKDIAKDLEIRYDTLNYELDGPLSKEKNKKVIGLMKDELGRKIMAKIVELRAKTYTYLVNEDNIAKSTKECVIKRKLKFENYKNGLEATILENTINYLEKQINLDSYEKNHKELVKSNKFILQIHQTFKNDGCNASTKEIITMFK